MNVFDIIGPVMIGPSSSHTAGAVRLGRVAWKILGDKVVKADIELSGSFAQTYRGHGTDKALIAGVMGMDSDDERIRHSLQLAKESGMEFAFHETEIPGAHPNTARDRRDRRPGGYHRDPGGLYWGRQYPDHGDQRDGGLLHGAVQHPAGAPL